MENQSPHALPSGTLLGRGLYRLEECLGQGGFGITYRAVEPVGNQPVVVKELFPRGAMRQGATVAPDAVLKPVWSRACEQFRQEGECLQRLSHPGVVRVYGVLEENNTVYLVMAYVEGEVLSAYLERQGGRLPVEEVVAVAEQVADALQTVHAAGWLHRDLKPHNLYRRKDGQLVLLDFGAARQFQADETGTHSVILTTGMAPPEQYRTKAKRGAFTDVYGLAATLYVLLTGTWPECALDREERDTLKPPHELAPAVPVPLSLALMQGLALDPKGRPDNAPALAKALRSCLAAPGRDRKQDLWIPREFAVLGGEYPVTPGSTPPVRVTIPAGACEGQTLRLVGQGEPGRNGGAPGDLRLNLRLGVVEPEGARQQQVDQEKAAAHQRVKEAEQAAAQQVAATQQTADQRGKEAERATARQVVEAQQTAQQAVAARQIAERLSRRRVLSAGASCLGVGAITSQLVGGLLGRPQLGPLIMGRSAGDRRINVVDGADLVWVPPGEFSMGSTEGAENERPVRRVVITKGFWLYRTEVTNAQYGRFLQANPNHRPPEYWQDSQFNAPQQPVVGVDWHDATAYCQWAGGRLPTEAEWEYAARGPQGQEYPWGNGEPNASLAVISGSGGPALVGSKPAGASWCGALDLAGSVWEWCEDWYDGRFHLGRPDPDRDPVRSKQDSLRFRVLRGGSWNDPENTLRGAFRNLYPPGLLSSFIGFRVVVVGAAED